MCALADNSTRLRRLGLGLRPRLRRLRLRLRHRLRRLRLSLGPRVRRLQRPTKSKPHLNFIYGRWGQHKDKLI